MAALDVMVRYVVHQKPALFGENRRVGLGMVRGTIWFGGGRCICTVVFGVSESGPVLLTVHAAC